MKHAFSHLLTGIVIASCATSTVMAQSQTQSLGAYARAVKKNAPTQKSPPKSFDNDNLPGNGAVSVVGPAAEGAPAKDGDNGQDKDKDKKEANVTAAPDPKADGQKKAELPQVKPGQTIEDRDKAIAAWKQKIDEQKSKTDLLARELDVTQREYRLRSTAYNADVNNRTRASADWQAEEAKFKQQIAEKQKSLDESKAKLSEMQEQARKAGVPNSASE